jgi:hypothetical protein
MVTSNALPKIVRLTNDTDIGDGKSDEIQSAAGRDETDSDELTRFGQSDVIQFTGAGRIHQLTPRSRHGSEFSKAQYQTVPSLQYVRGGMDGVSSTS